MKEDLAAPASFFSVACASQLLAAAAADADAGAAAAGAWAKADRLKTASRANSNLFMGHLDLRVEGVVIVQRAAVMHAMQTFHFVIALTQAQARPNKRCKPSHCWDQKPCP